MGEKIEKAVDEVADQVENQGPAEKAGEQLDQAIEEAGETLQKAGKTLGKAMQKAGQELEKKGGG